MNIKLIWEKIKQFPVPVICLLLCLLLAGGWYWRRGTVLELTVKKEQLVDQRNLIDANFREGDGLKEEYKQSEEITATIEKRLMTHHNQALNKKNFHRLVNRYEGIQLINLQQGNLWEKKDKGKPVITLYQPFEYKVSLEGSYRDLVQLVYDLNNGNFYEPTEGEEEEGKLFIRLESITCASSNIQDASVLKVNLVIHILGRE